MPLATAAILFSTDSGDDPMQSHQLLNHHNFRSSTAGIHRRHGNSVRNQIIDQRTPARDVPRNVMEALVAEEIDEQMQQLSVREQKTLERSQIMGYALNRLPGLYVTSEKGWERQWSQGKNKYQCQIKIAVRQGIAAVLRDPLRDVTVLSSHPPDVAEAALNQLRRLLMRQELSWHNIVYTIQMLLVNGEMDFPDSRRAPEAEGESMDAPKTKNRAENDEVISTSPATSGQEQNAEMESVLKDFFDWDSHPLHQRGY